MEKACKKCASKASLRPLFNFGKQPENSLNARSSSKGRVFYKTILKKPRTKSVLMKKIIKGKGA